MTVDAHPLSSLSRTDSGEYLPSLQTDNSGDNSFAATEFMKNVMTNGPSGEGLVDVSDNEKEFKRRTSASNIKKGTINIDEESHDQPLKDGKLSMNNLKIIQKTINILMTISPKSLKSC
jgi:hypothetical protein